MVAQLVIVQQVYLIKYENDRHAISLGRGQKTVDERRAGLWLRDSNDKQCLINIRCKDVALLRQVDAFADDVVLAVVYFCNPIAVTHSNPITYSNRIRGANSLDAKIALYLTIKELAIVRQDGVPASSILNDESVHQTVMISLFLASISSSSFLMYLSCSF